MSLLWVRAVKPRPTGKIPLEDGLFYRLHPRSRPFSRDDAHSHFIDPPPPPEVHDYEWLDDEDRDDAHSEGMQIYQNEIGPRPGYSAYRNPHHVRQYADIHGLNTSDSDVIGFHGNHIGFGHNDEDLVQPHHDKPFFRMPYHEFERRLRRTQKPGYDVEEPEVFHDGWPWHNLD